MNTQAVPVATYSCEVIDWTLDKIPNLDRMTRKKLFMNRMLAKKNRCT